LVPKWVVIAAAVFCFVAVGDLPYGFYKLLRWVVCIVGGLLAFEAVRQKRVGWAWGFGIVAVIFNPISPFSFEKELWRFLDAGAGIVLLFGLRRGEREGN
jgi:uncharacterized membrane protein